MNKESKIMNNEYDDSCAGSRDTITRDNMHYSPSMIHNSRKGFTLIELLVSLSLFSLLTLLAVGGFVRSLKTERQSSASMLVNSNINTVVEQIAREIRTGNDFCINGNICPSSSVLSFVNANNSNVTYCLQNDSIVRNAGPDCGSGQEITGESVFIQYLTFIISGNGDGDGSSPRITILIGANPKEQGSSNYSVNFQTTVSSRIIGT